MPQFETVEDLRRVKLGAWATLIPSWNTGFGLRDSAGQPTGALVRPGQRLHILEEAGRQLRVRQEAEGLEGWLPAHVLAPWPGPAL